MSKTSKPRTEKQVAAAELSKAFSQRFREYQKKKEDALVAFESAPASVAVKEANKAMEQALEARNAEEQRLLDQIKEIQAKIAALGEKHEIPKLSQQRRDAYSVWHAAKKQVEQDVDLAYPDMCDVFTSRDWQRRKAELGME